MDKRMAQGVLDEVCGEVEKGLLLEKKIKDERKEAQAALNAAADQIRGEIAASQPVDPAAADALLEHAVAATKAGIDPFGSVVEQRDEAERKLRALKEKQAADRERDERLMAGEIQDEALLESVRSELQAKRKSGALAAQAGKELDDVCDALRQSTAARKEHEDAMRDLDRVCDAFRGQASGTIPTPDDVTRTLDRIVDGIREAQRSEAAASARAEEDLEREVRAMQFEMARAVAEDIRSGVPPPKPVQASDARAAAAPAPAAAAPARAAAAPAPAAAAPARAAAAPAPAAAAPAPAAAAPARAAAAPTPAAPARAATAPTPAAPARAVAAPVSGKARRPSTPASEAAAPPRATPAPPRATPAPARSIAAPTRAATTPAAVLSTPPPPRLASMPIATPPQVSRYNLTAGSGTLEGRVARRIAAAAADTVRVDESADGATSVSVDGRAAVTEFSSVCRVIAAAGGTETSSPPLYPYSEPAKLACVEGAFRQVLQLVAQVAQLRGACSPTAASKMWGLAMWPLTAAGLASDPGGLRQLLQQVGALLTTIDRSYFKVGGDFVCTDAVSVVDVILLAALEELAVLGVTAADFKAGNLTRFHNSAKRNPALRCTEEPPPAAQGTVAAVLRQLEAASRAQAAQAP